MSDWLAELRIRFANAIGFRALLGAGVLLSASPVPGAEVYSSIAKIRGLSNTELAQRHPVKFEGVVFGVISRTGRLMVQNEGKGLILIPPSKNSLPPVGARIVVEGATEPQGSTMVKASRIEVLDKSAGQPAPESLAISAALSRRPLNGAFVKIPGLVLNARTNGQDVAPLMRHRVVMTLKSKGDTIRVVAPVPNNSVTARLELARIRARGQLVDVKPSPDSEPERFLWIPQWNEVEFEAEGPADPFAVAVHPIKDVMNKKPAPGDGPVRIRGHVQERRGPNLVVVGFHAELRSPNFLARHGDSLELPPGQVLDLLGFPEEAEDGSRFEITDVRQLGLPRGISAEDLPKNSLGQYLPVMSSREEINALSPGQVTNGWPVRLWGIVSHVDEANRFFYLQIGNGLGIRVSWRGTNAMPGRLQRGAIKGHTIPGVRTPWLEGSEFTVAGEEATLNPWTVGSPGFVAGRFTGSALRLFGVVRSVDQSEEGTATLRVAWQGNLYRAHVRLADAELPKRLVDAKVTLRGVSEAEPGRHSVIPREMLLIQSPADIEIRGRGPASPFAGRSIPIANVLGQAWQQADIQRVKLSGTVTWAEGRRCFLSDGRHGIELRGLTPAEVRPGDSVAVVGFPERDRIMVRLADVTFRKLGRAALPPAVAVKPAEVFERQLNGRRVRVRGEIVTHSANQAGRVELTGKGFAFTAIAPADTPKVQLARWLPGSVVELTGVCQYVVGEDREDSFAPESFRVYLNDADAVTVISKPSWWTEERVGGLALLVMGVAGWAAFLRIRVHQSRHQFLTAFNANPMPAWIVRAADFQCVEVNAEFERLFGWSRAEVTGRKMEEAGFWPNTAECRSFEQGVAEKPSVRAVEAGLKSRDGQLHNTLLSTEPIDNLGEPDILIIAYDFTEKLKLIAELRQAQKMEAVGQLAAGIAHDFNNLLTVISGNLGLVHLDPSLAPNSLELITDVENAAARAADLTSQLLAFSRKSVLERKPLSLMTVATDAAALLGRTLEETIEVKCRCSERDIVVSGDFGMLSQVLLNLGVNSRDAMPNGGVISHSTRRVSYDRASKPNSPDALPGDFGVIEFADNGEGMSPEIRDKVFEPFFTTKEVGKGTGLGLSTAYGILRQHGGWIEVESAPGAGTTFRMYLPVATAAPDTSPTAESPRPEPRGRETIFVIEDDATVREVVARTLKHYGYEVLLAEDGPKARTVWAEHHSRIDLVLTDLVMPNGMSGFDLARELRGERADLKVVIASGYNTEMVGHEKAAAAGMSYLPKPFSASVAGKAVRDCLDG